MLYILIYYLLISTMYQNNKTREYFLDRRYFRHDDCIF